MDLFYFFRNQDQCKEKKTAAAARQAAEKMYNSQRTTDIGAATYVIAHGGDGTMLDTLREIAAYKKTHPDWQVPAAIGINYGDVGYLMNSKTINSAHSRRTAQIAAQYRDKAHDAPPTAKADPFAGCPLLLPVPRAASEYP